MELKMKDIWNNIESFFVHIIKNKLRIPVKDSAMNSLSQFIKFGLVGVSNTVISYVTYLVLVILGIHYMPANFIAFILSVLNSFYWNNKYVFTENREKRFWLAALMKTFVAYGSTGLLLNSFLLYFEVDILHISATIAPLFNLVITIPLNFVINKFWAYGNKKTNDKYGE